MFQSFEVTTRPEDGPPRLAALRRELETEGLDGFFVPRADAHQGEYVAPADERLAWLTGFTGSAGFCIALRDTAGLFVDGRYTLQARAQAAADFSTVDWPKTKPGAWLAERFPEGGRIGLDPWLHTLGEVDALKKDAPKLAFVETDNLVDRIWHDQPARPAGPVEDYPIARAGRSSVEKRREIAATLIEDGQSAAVLTLPDSICWLLNIRGSDIPRIPLVHAFAILHADGRVALFSDPAKFDRLGPDPEIELGDWAAFPDALRALNGPVRVDKATAPLAVSRILEAAEIEIDYAEDPCVLPKATKNATEIAGTAEAHLRDGAAMVEFLAWLDTAAPSGGLTEIDVVRKLEGFRRATNALRDISFETICGAGPNGAIVHYRVTEATNRAVAPGELLLVDSGGQYLDGTTDITRTVAVGPPGEEERAAFTRVLKGMITISRIRFPNGLAGRDLDALARAPLWLAGQDYDHGTGHGVGVYLGVHEGPQRLSRISSVPLKPGMILSNEPGYYRPGAFGIRIENLVVVEEAPALPGADEREMLSFQTLTYVPIDRRLIRVDLLTADERDWLNAYHAEVLEKIGPRVAPAARTWLTEATSPL